MNYTDDELIAAALKVAEKRLHYGNHLTDPQLVRDYLRLKVSGLTEEAFGVIWLNAKHGVIDCQVLFRGSIDCASVYPRVLVKEGLAANAAACIVYHNHPSGDPEPSQADVTLTRRLKEALVLVDIRLLDHMVVGSSIISLAETGRV